MVSIGPSSSAVATPPAAGVAAGVPGVARGRYGIVDHHLLLLVTAGHGPAWVDFHRYDCRPGALLWVRPGQVVRYGQGVDVVAVAWDPPFLGSLSDPPTIIGIDEDVGPTHWQLSGEDEDAIIDEVSQLLVDLVRYGPDGPATALLRHQLAVLVLRVGLVPPSGNGGPPIASERSSEASDAVRVMAGDDTETFRRFRREVEAGYARCRQVAVYADRIGCSVRTLTRACLSHTGRTAKQVIDDRVVLQAKRLLAATRLPVATIGDGLGFPGPTHFGRFFLREEGCTPGAFRAIEAASGHPSRPRVPAPRPAPRLAPRVGSPVRGALR